MGRITLGGQQIDCINKSELREHLRLVPQEAVLFSQTIQDNIAFSRPDASFAEIKYAAEQAEADSFIQDLPEGYNTLVGEKGVRLSGGQRQRLAIARTILRKPSVLLLDEATSALDSQSEALVQKALANLRQGRSSIVIAHRLSTVIDADRILVLDKGQIIAEGTHEQLLLQSPLYHQLAQHQFLTT